MVGRRPCGEGSATVTVDELDVRTALDAVAEPDTGRSITSLGLVRGLAVGDTVRVTLACLSAAPGLRDALHDHAWRRSPRWDLRSMSTCAASPRRKHMTSASACNRVVPPMPRRHSPAHASSPCPPAKGAWASPRCRSTSRSSSRNVVTAWPCSTPTCTASRCRA
ncbi:MAG: DUF59 domain-containing protein [Nitriliruptorales bacterium]|nr:DUF59 domain-containing protein [Nitriliruptorales bacterium]